MSEKTLGLSPEAQAMLDEEQALLRRAVASIQKAQEAAAQKSGFNDLRSVAALRALRDEAVGAHDDDLPSVLHEMSVRQSLLNRDAKTTLPPLQSPYLAHLRLREGKVSKDYLLGHITFLDTPSAVRIIDWRIAPVAQIFYRYREGDDYEEQFPGRLAQGIVEARRIVVIENGELTAVLADHLALRRQSDGTWVASDRSALAMQSGGAGSAARPGALGLGIGQAGRNKDADITALLDSEQFEAVTAPADQPLLVLGSAGSGKTTVALHRFARISVLDRARYPLSDMKIVVPEEALARLSRRLLEPLGAGAAQVQTLDTWATKLATEVFGDEVKLCVDAPGLVISLKRHPSLYRALKTRFSDLRPANATYPRLRRRLFDALTDRGFLASVVEASEGDLPRSAIDETVSHAMLQLAEPMKKQLSSITDKERKRALDGRAIWEDTPDELAGTVDLEDLPILLFMKASCSALGTRTLSHLMLDEAEDFSLFELSVFGQLLGDQKSVTLAGDEAQQTSDSFAGWQEALETLGLKQAPTCRLAISYRCPRSVTEFAQQLLGKMADESRAQAMRAGAPIGFFHFPQESQAQIFLAEALRDLMDREPKASVGLIANSPESAKRIYQLVAEMPETRLVLEGQFSFEPGIDVTDVDNAKGLEFDYVVVPDATANAYPDSAEARRRLYVAVTRTSHQLWVLSGGTRSPLLSSIESIAPAAMG